MGPPRGLNKIADQDHPPKVGDDPGRLFLRTKSKMSKMTKSDKKGKSENGSKNGRKLSKIIIPGVKFGPWGGSNLAKFGSKLGHFGVVKSDPKKPPQNDPFWGGFWVVWPAGPSALILTSIWGWFGCPWAGPVRGGGQNDPKVVKIDFFIFAILQKNEIFEF